MSTPGGNLLTLIVGEIGRPSRGRARAGSGTSTGAGAGAEAGRAEQPRWPRQWSCQWAGDGPGEVSTGCDGEADLTLSLGPEDAQAVWDDQLPPSVAFMQGRLKTSGDNALLLRVLAWTATPGFAAARQRWQREGLFEP